MPEEEVEKKTEEEITPQDPQDEFDEAWNEDDEDKQKPTDQSDDQTTDDDDTDTSDEDGEQGDLFNPPSDQSGTEGQEDDTDDQLSLEEQNKKLIQKMKSWEGRISAANQRAADAEARLKQLEETQVKGTPSDTTDTLPADDDDDAVLSEFIEEFPSLEKPVKALVRKIVKNTVDKKLRPVEQQIQAVTANVQETSTNHHIEAIQQAHPDWEDIYSSGRLESWIKSQPSFIQPTLNRIVEQGETKEVIEMFDQYKKSVGKTEPATDHEHREESKQERARSMRSVRASSGGPPKDQTKAAKDDFDAAWDEALSAD